MFNLKHFKLVKELKNIKPQLNWLSFSNKYSKSKKELLNSIIENNKFIEEDLKIRVMVEEMLVKEFSEDIKNIKSYNFLVDSVVN
ncbi:MAG: hypothetical protein LUH05_01685, partial [Candidatus Gastranaerophilales bacterium]|nr:hypothetical protein [Candidatus Gastranaerophilales bacterium]